MLIYKHIRDDLLAKIPELRESIEENFRSYYDLNTEMPGAYPIFEDVIEPMVLKLTETPGNDQLLKRVFAFVEEMACSQDKEVVNLLWIALLKPFVYDREHIKSLWKYMGERTKQLATEVARSGGWQENLPHADNGN